MNNNNALNSCQRASQHLRRSLMTYFQQLIEVTALIWALCSTRLIALSSNVYKLGSVYRELLYIPTYAPFLPLQQTVSVVIAVPLLIILSVQSLEGPLLPLCCSQYTCFLSARSWSSTMVFPITVMQMIHSYMFLACLCDVNCWMSPNFSKWMMIIWSHSLWSNMPSSSVHCLKTWGCWKSWCHFWCRSLFWGSCEERCSISCFFSAEILPVSCWFAQSYLCFYFSRLDCCDAVHAGVSQSSSTDSNCRTLLPDFNRHKETRSHESCANWLPLAACLIPYWL